MWARKLREFHEWAWPLGWLVAAACGLAGALYMASPATWRLDLNDTSYSLAVARTDSARERGLGGRTSLQPREGMIFVFDAPGKRCFWMKDMQFPLDIIWVDKAQRVVRVMQKVPPESYPERFCADNTMYVVELPAGTVAGQQVQPGQHLSF